MVEVASSNLVTPTKHKPPKLNVYGGFLMSEPFILPYCYCLFCSICAKMAYFKQLFTPRLRQGLRHETAKATQKR